MPPAPPGDAPTARGGGRTRRRGSKPGGPSKKDRRRRSSLADVVATGYDRDDAVAPGATAASRWQKDRGTHRRRRRLSTGSFAHAHEHDDDHHEHRHEKHRADEGSVWVGHIPDNFAHSELELSKVFARFGTVLSVTVRRKAGHLKSWAFVTFLSKWDAAEAVTAGLRKEVVVVDEDGEECALKVRKVKVDEELRKHSTRGLSQMWETQNDKIGAAVKIQKTVRGNQARRSLDGGGGGGGGRGRETTVGLLMRTDLTKADDALWPEAVTSAIASHSAELAHYLRWLRIEGEASAPLVPHRLEVLAKVRHAMGVPKRGLLQAGGAALLGLLALCGVLLALWLGAEGGDSAATAGGTPPPAPPAVVDAACSVDGSGMIASAGSAFELQVRAAAHTTSDDCGAVDRLILSDLTTNAAQVVSCTESVASNRTAVCSVSAGAIPLGTYVARLAHAASGGDCGRCGGSLQVLGECSSLSFDATGAFSLTVSAHCTRGIATVSVDGTDCPLDSGSGTTSATCSRTAPADADAYSGYYSSATVTDSAGVVCAECTRTLCNADERVQSNACVGCELGATRPAGDNAAGPDTTCTPEECGVNEYVSSNTCLACPTGKVRISSSGRTAIHGAGSVSTANWDANLATGADTLCWPAACDSDMNFQTGNSVSCDDASDCCWAECLTGAEQVCA